jgi:hypothetical protein
LSARGFSFKKNINGDKNGVNPERSAEPASAVTRSARRDGVVMASPCEEFGGLRLAHRASSPPNGELADGARRHWADELLDFGSRLARLRAHTICAVPMTASHAPATIARITIELIGQAMTTMPASTLSTPVKMYQPRSGNSFAMFRALWPLGGLVAGCSSTKGGLSEVTAAMASAAVSLDQLYRWWAGHS